jgi:hypothetical protein
MTDDNDDVDQQEVKRTDHGVSITTELKRGTGTRDQDKHILKAKGATFDEAAHYHRQGMEYLTGDHPTEAAVVDLARRVQPGDQDGDDDD